MSMPSRAEFLESVANLVRTSFPDVTLEKNEAEFSLKINENWVSLEHLYRASNEDSDRLADHVKRWIHELLRAAEAPADLSATFEEVRERIMPMVIADTTKTPPGTMVRQELLPGLCVAYALDAQHTISYIPQRLFDSWHIDLDDVHEAALQNLIGKSETLQAHAAQDEQGEINLILVQTLDGYDASRILLPGLHDRLREHLGSPFLAAIPNRDILICFREEAELIPQVRQQVQQDYGSMPHQITSDLFLMTTDGIAPYTPA